MAIEGLNPENKIACGQDIPAAGIAPSPLTNGAYRWKFAEPVLCNTRKKKLPEVRLAFTVEECGPGIGDDQKDRTGEAHIMLPEGDDFTEATQAGRGNRARIAELKSLLLACGAPEKVVHENIKGGMQLKKLDAMLRSLVKDKTGVVFYHFAEGDQGPTIKYIAAGETADAVMAGTIVPNIKKSKKKGQSIAGSDNVSSFVDDEEISNNGVGSGGDAGHGSDAFNFDS